MKLVKFIKYIDTINKCDLFDVDADKVVWSGATFLLDAAFDEKERELFCRDCIEDGDIEMAELTKKAIPFKDYKLAKNEVGEAVIFFPYVNEHGVPWLKIQINIKKC